jgi:hypothetical protein
VKGIIFNLAEEVVTALHGEDVWDAVLDKAGLEGAYTSLGSYPDEELTGLVVAASELLGSSPDAVLRLLGEGAMPRLAERFPSFFTGHTSSRTFILTLNDVIHAEVRKLYPDATVPDFEFESPSDSEVVITYLSPRQLCALAEGFVAGAAHHYGEDVTIDQPECMHRGDRACLIHCQFAPHNA